MGWWVGWAGELTCDARMTTEYSAVARAVLLLTIFQSCIPLAGLRQRRRLVLPLTVHHLRACRRPLDSSVARDARYRGIIFASDGVDGRSAERERKSPQPRSFQQRHKSSDPSRCGTALVRSVNKEKSVFSSNAVCSPEPWRFERRVSISPRLWARMRVEALRFRARRVARIIAAGPCIDKDHSSTWSSSSFAGAVEAASSRWST